MTKRKVQVFSTLCCWRISWRRVSVLRPSLPHLGVTQNELVTVHFRWSHSLLPQASTVQPFWLRAKAGRQSASGACPPPVRPCEIAHIRRWTGRKLRLKGLRTGLKESDIMTGEDQQGSRGSTPTAARVFREGDARWLLCKTLASVPSIANNGKAQAVGDVDLLGEIQGVASQWTVPWNVQNVWMGILIITFII